MSDTRTITEEPTTPTGKRLEYSFDGLVSTITNRDDILAIEAEAREQERERLRAGIERLPSPVFMPQDIERIYAGESLPLVTRYAVLILLADPDEADR